MKKHIIWSNVDLDIDDWRYGYKEYLEINEMDDKDPNDENAIYEWMIETNDMYLDDERMNLNKEVDGRILIIADLGLWNGRKSGYKILGANIKDIFNINPRGFDYAEFYGDGYNIKATEHHHDGTNYAELRELTCKGSNYALNHSWDSDREVHETLMSSNFYTRLPHYAHKVWGCKKGA